MDQIANMLTTIRNAQAVKHETVKVPYSKINFGIAEILKSKGWLDSVEIKDRGSRNWLILTLKYNSDGSPVISGIQRISKPGKRIYKGYGEIPVIRQGYGLAILSTPRGIIGDQQARREKVGGELLCQVY